MKRLIAFTISVTLTLCAGEQQAESGVRRHARLQPAACARCVPGAASTFVHHLIAERSE